MSEENKIYSIILMLIFGMPTAFIFGEISKYWLLGATGTLLEYQQVGGGYYFGGILGYIFFSMVAAVIFGNIIGYLLRLLNKLGRSRDPKIGGTIGYVVGFFGAFVSFKQFCLSAEDLGISWLYYLMPIGFAVFLIVNVVESASEGEFKILSD